MKLFSKTTLYLALFASFMLSCDGKRTTAADQYFEQGDYAKAITAYDEHLEYNPEDVRSFYNRGRAYEELGEFDKSLASYEEALKVEPTNVNVLMSIGKYHFRNNNNKDAAFYFDKAQEAAPKSKLANFLSARSHHKLGETKEAMQGYNEAIDLDGNYGEAYLYRGALKILSKKKKSGCADIQKAQSLNVPEAEAALQEYCQ